MGESLDDIIGLPPSYVLSLPTKLKYDPKNCAAAFSRDVELCSTISALDKILSSLYSLNPASHIHLRNVFLRRILLFRFNNGHEVNREIDGISEILIDDKLLVVVVEEKSRKTPKLSNYLQVASEVLYVILDVLGRKKNIDKFLSDNRPKIFLGYLAYRDNGIVELVVKAEIKNGIISLDIYFEDKVFNLSYDYNSLVVLLSNNRENVENGILKTLCTNYYTEQIVQLCNSKEYNIIKDLK